MGEYLKDAFPCNVDTQLTILISQNAVRVLRWPGTGQEPSFFLQDGRDEGDDTGDMGSEEDSGFDTASRYLLPICAIAEGF